MQRLIRTQRYITAGMRSARDAGDREALADWQDTMAEFISSPGFFCRLADRPAAVLSFVDLTWRIEATA